MKIKVLVTILFLVALLPTKALSEGGRVIDTGVRFVIDGDTIVLKGGEKLRYIGIDTPERDEPFYKRARARNRELVKGSILRVEICPDEPRDKYGRLLGWVSVDGVDVGEELLREGLARTLMIPPCGLKMREKYKAIKDEARKKGLGIWGQK